MAALSPSLVAGSHYPIYDLYYQIVDPTNKGSVAALDAAKFLKKSGLSDVILSKIWDVADSNGKGYLTKSGFFVALKLVALVQDGKDVTASNLHIDAPLPNMGDATAALNASESMRHNSISKTVTPPAVTLASTSDWAMKPEEKAKFDQLFISLKPTNGVIPGNKVKRVLMDSKLPMDTLSKIWDLADMDKDGALNRHEFCVAMHLVYKALEKYAIPSILPRELLPDSIRKDSPLLPDTIPVLPAIPNGIRSVTPIVPSITTPLTSPPLIPTVTSPPLIPTVTSPPLISTTTSPTTISMVSPPTVLNDSTSDVPWIISKAEKERYDVLFTQADLDRDGYVSGHEIKNVFLQSGVPQHILAHIWNLCDTEEEGKLNSEQFALALWLINRKINGIDPPNVLRADMVPPSCRKSINSNKVQEEPIPINPELEALSKEVEEMKKEKLGLEYSLAEKQESVESKKVEVDNLKGELDALLATLKQLESQKVEAQKRLSDLKAQTDLLQLEILSTTNDIDSLQEQVDKLKEQADEQERRIKIQEKEINDRKREIEEIAEQENNLQKEQNEIRKQLESLAEQSENCSSQILEIKKKVDELDDIENQIKEAISNADEVLQSNDIALLKETYMRIEPIFRDSGYFDILKDVEKEGAFADNDPFSANDAFSKQTENSSAFGKDPFSNSNDPFSSKPFEADKGTTGNDPFNSFSKAEDMFAQNPVQNFDTSRTNDENKDAFGCDPFAILHAPSKPSTPSPITTTVRSESPSPALPPKKDKQPPPRPAPPRPAPPATSPFSDESGGNFADFSDFSKKTAGYGSVTKTSNTKTDIWDDPFRDHRYEDPFNMNYDTNSKKIDSLKCNGKSTKLAVSPLPPEEQQLAWATMESVKSEKERRKKQEQQEKADLQLALKLSKSEVKKKSFRSKILH